MKRESEWIWLSDDDAYLRPDALEKLARCYDGLSREEQEKTVVMSGAVHNDGKIHYAHRNHLIQTRFKIQIIPSAPEEYQKPYFTYDVFSYVGIAIKKSALEKAGLDEKDYFIHCDDQEHALRLRKEGQFLCVPESIIDHDSPPENSKQLTWVSYYTRRNDLLMIRKNFPFRYFLLRWVRRYLELAIFSKAAPEKKKMMRAAFYDALRGKKGLHPVYRPGWKREE